MIRTAAHNALIGEGNRRARRRGGYTAEDRARARSLRAQGFKLREVAELVGASVASVQKWTR